MNTLSIIAALALLVAPFAGGTSNAQVSTNIPGAITAPAQSKKAPAAAPSQQDERAAAIKALKALKAYGITKQASYSNVVCGGQSSTLTGKLSARSGLALLTLSCDKDPKSSAALLVHYDDASNTWEPLDMFIGINLDAADDAKP